MSPFCCDSHSVGARRRHSIWHRMRLSKGGINYREAHTTRKNSRTPRRWKQVSTTPREQLETSNRKLSSGRKLTGASSLLTHSWSVSHINPTISQLSRNEDDDDEDDDDNNNTTMMMMKMKMMENSNIFNVSRAKQPNTTPTINAR